MKASVLFSAFYASSSLFRIIRCFLCKVAWGRTWAVLALAGAITTLKPEPTRNFPFSVLGLWDKGTINAPAASHIAGIFRPLPGSRHVKNMCVAVLRGSDPRKGCVCRQSIPAHSPPRQCAHLQCRQLHTQLLPLRRVTPYPR
jgi:hypothetical protein